MHHMNGGIRRIAFQPVVHPVVWVGGKQLDVAGGKAAVSRQERFIFALML